MMAACIEKPSVEELVAIKNVITNLSYPAERVEESVGELSTLLYNWAQCGSGGGAHSSQSPPRGVDLRNTTFSLGIVKALLGIMGSSTKVGLLTKSVGCTALLAHANDEARALLGEMGIIPILLKLLSPQPEASDPFGTTNLSWHEEWVEVYEQCLVALRKLTCLNTDNQQQLAREGGLKLIIDLAMDKSILRNSGRFSIEAKQCLCQLTLGKKFICRAAPVPDVCRGAVLSSYLSLTDPGLTLSAQYPAFYVDLVTQEEEWIKDTMIEMGVVWPDHTPFPDRSKWTCVTVTSVEDGGHVWCQFCTEKANPRVEAMKDSLMKMKAPSSEATLSATTVGDVYATFCDPSFSKEPCCLSLPQWCRTRLLARESETATSNVNVLAVDFGFTMSVPLSHLASLPMECRGIPPQAIPCKLIHVAPLPVSYGILENTAAILCNMSFEKYAFRCEIKTFKGIEALLNLVQCPHLDIVEQSIGALINMAISEQLREEIGKRGAVHVLLAVCRYHSSNEDLLERFLSCLFSLVTGSNGNLARLVEDKDNQILSEIAAHKHSEKVSRCMAGLLRCVDPPRGPEAVSPKPSRHAVTQKQSPPTGSRPMKHRRSFKSVYRCLGDDEDSFHEEDDLENERQRLNKKQTRREAHDGDDLVTQQTLCECPREPSGSVSNTKHYLVGSLVTQHAGVDDTQVCIDVENVSGLPKRPLVRAICALKNTGKEAKMFIGVKKNRVVCGVKMNRSQRDKLCVGIGQVMGEFTPYLEPSQYHLLFVPVAFKTTGQRTCVKDYFVVEITLNSAVYPQVYTVSERREGGQPQQRCYYRVGGHNDRLSCQELRDTVAREEARKYETQIKDLEENIAKLETALGTTQLAT